MDRNRNVQKKLHGKPQWHPEIAKFLFLLWVIGLQFAARNEKVKTKKMELQLLLLLFFLN
jgi:hypothetical protein